MAAQPSAIPCKNKRLKTATIWKRDPKGIRRPKCLKLQGSQQIYGDFRKPGFTGLSSRKTALDPFSRFSDFFELAVSFGITQAKRYLVARFCPTLVTRCSDRSSAIAPATLAVGQLSRSARSPAPIGSVDNAANTTSLNASSS